MNPIWSSFFFFFAPFVPGAVLDVEDDKQAGHTVCFGQTHIIGRNTKKL